MAADAVTSDRESTRARYSRAFRPLTCWLIFSLALLAWDFHRRNLPRTVLNFEVRVEGKTITNPSAYVATFGTQRVNPGTVVPLGKDLFKVEMPDTEPFQVPLFVWYGDNDAGTIDLKWSRGMLDLKVEPKAKHIKVLGAHYGFTSTNWSQSSQSVPVGRYTISAVFEHFSGEYECLVSRNETSHFVVKPDLGTIELTSEPAVAGFRLAGEQNRIVIQGDAPTVLPGLPAGKYQLRMWRQDYVKDLSVDLKRWGTLPVKVEFEYGQVAVASDPPGATLYSGKKELGQTPLTLNELKPGRYEFRLEKEGFGSVELNTEVVGTNITTLATNLVSVRYVEAMGNARRLVSGLSPDYRQALANVELALKERPQDVDATALKAELEVASRDFDERQAQAKKQSELDARKRSARDAFARATADLRHADMFDAHLWEFQSQFTKVREGILRAFNKGTTTWIVEKETKLGDETTVFFCKPKGLLSLGKMCVVLASQVDSGEVHVYSKFWDYVVSNKITLSFFQGVTPDSLIPVHKNNFPPEQAVNIEARRRAMSEAFRTSLKSEIR